MSLPSTLHPDARDFLNLARERLGKRKTRRILEHCKECPECAEKLLDTVRGESQAAEKLKLSVWNWLSIAVLVLAIVVVVVTLLWMLQALPGSIGGGLDAGVSAALAEVVHAERPDGWLEDAFTHAMVSADGLRMLRVDGLGVRLLDLTTGEARRDDLLRDLDQVMGAGFDGNGSVARFGNRRRDLGWFLEAGGELRLTSIPPDGAPVWAPGNTEVLWTRPPGTHLYLGAPPDARRFPVNGRILGLAWSPRRDAAYALAMSEAGTSSLLRVGPISGELETLRTDLDASALPNGVAVTPDGNTLFVALASADPPDAEARHDAAADRDLDIYALDTRSGALSSIVVGPGDDFWPWVAGDYLYWTHNDWNASVVLVPLRAGGTGAPVLVSGAALGEPDAHMPRWRPDGGLLAFTRGAWRLADWGLNLDSVAVPVDEDGRVAGPEVGLVTGYHEDRTPAWSLDGRWLAYRSRRSSTPVPYYAGPEVVDDIFVRRADAPAEEEVRLTDFGWEIGNPSWSPNGRRLVFDSWDRGGVPRVSRPFIAVFDPELGELVDLEPLLLPDDISGSVSAVWSPVADELLLIERVDPETQSLWVSTTTGATADKLIEFASSTESGAGWTPDGNHIVYSALTDGRMQLFSVSRRGGEPRRLTDEAVDLLHPSVSPDGRWVAATRLEQGKEVRRLPLGALR